MLKLIEVSVCMGNNFFQSSYINFFIKKYISLKFFILIVLDMCEEFRYTKIHLYTSQDAAT